MNMSEFIITAEPFEQFDCNGKSIGMSEKLAVFYSPYIGRTRYYRSSLNNPSKGLKLLSFKTEKAAQIVCDITNEISNNTFKVETIPYENNFCSKTSGNNATKQIKSKQNEKTIYI